MRLPSYTYHGAPGEIVPKDVEQVIIDVEAIIIRSKAFSGCASLVSLVIPTSITIIEDLAFEKCTSLKELKIPESITSIGNGAFLQCKALEHVEIPTAITSISAYTFHGCESLSAVSILGPVTSIGRNAFYRCASMKSIILPPSVSSIAELAFSECFSLKSMKIPAAVNEIAWGAFQRCFSLETIKLSESVSTIAWGAFAECLSLASLELPSSLTTIGDYAFDGCTSLTVIAIPSQVTQIGSSAFAGCSSLQSVAIPQSITIIDPAAFAGCTSLISVTIPDSVTRIGESAFEECKSLTSVACPSSIRRIGDRAFKGCKCLLSIVIPESIESIGDRAFSECRQLENGAEDCASDVALWLRFRFNRRPAHQLCYRPDVTKDKISACLASQPSLAKDLDSLGLTALHVLLMNDKAEPEMVKAFLSAYPDAASAIGPLSRFPLHFATMNTNLPLSVFTLLSHSFTKDERLVLTVQDETKSEIKSQNERRVCKVGKHSRSVHRRPVKKSEASIQAFDPLQRHGWVSFVIGVQDKSDAAKQCVRFIEEADIQVVRILAYFKDLHGRLAIQSATNDIRQAMERRILVFGRFELQRGPPISKSPVSCVLKVIDRRASDEYRNSFEMAFASDASAGQSRSIGEKGFKTFLNRLGVDFDGTGFRDIFAQWKSDPNMRMSEEQCIVLCTNVLDTGQPQEVALKFMSDTVRFRREIDLRDKLRLDSGYVVFVNNHFSYDTHDESFASALNVIRDEGGIECKDYKHAIVMPLADSNLDTIFRNERPPPNEIRSLQLNLRRRLPTFIAKGLSMAV
ncbi:hypothetical protein MHU86_7327 [Fragilaria crotonensis]|nr:hypothetical protein MHU86_7327 [Fragilaria crotonensis]